ncbi:23S rRNA pseudouridine(2605) synthase RluB [Thiohalomonas denitrificans]|uniref:Pseudouridine synthase n=1 Tax=Thiohalomonas denitrificans TaxID=415747 RepID=A0A1G5PIC5_9GAMM|nr:pseudouridine synthase [Thiohalomonas denitrificans]SCZ49282.1 ribosomal large subunit pseudouridine synthase B [Thiohalomonas denitrificans]
MSEKLQKLLARAGFGSRRELEAWITAGRVSVNGRVATLGDRVEESDLIRVDGRVLSRHRKAGPRRRVLVYNKPEGELVTRSDPEGRPTVFENLPRAGGGRWIPVGRLDVNTSGLLLLTNDGELANRLMHPSSEVEREYAVRIYGEPSPEVIKQLTEGVELEDGFARFDSVVDAGGEGTNHWFHVVIREGRNREVRRLWESQGGVVSRLIRVRYGPVILNRALRQGRFQDLPPPALKALLEAAGLPDEPEKERPASRRARHKPQGRTARPGKRRR